MDGESSRTLRQADRNYLQTNPGLQWWLVPDSSDKNNSLRKHSVYFWGPLIIMTRVCLPFLCFRAESHPRASRSNRTLHLMYSKTGTQYRNTSVTLRHTYPEFQHLFLTPKMDPTPKSATLYQFLSCISPSSLPHPKGRASLVPTRHHSAEGGGALSHQAATLGLT